MRTAPEAAISASEHMAKSENTQKAVISASTRSVRPGRLMFFTMVKNGSSKRAASGAPKRPTVAATMSVKSAESARQRRR